MMAFSKKKTNQHLTLHLGPQQAGRQSQSNWCYGCLKLYEHSEINTFRVHISFKWRVEKDNIDLR